MHRTSELVAVLALLVLMACTGKTPPPASPPPAAAAPARSTVTGEGAHLLLLVEVGAEGGRVLQARRVATALPRAAAPGRPGWRAEVVDPAGAVLHAVELTPPDAVHGEFPGPDGALERVEVRRDTSVVALRLPLLPTAASVRLSAAPAALPAGDARRARATAGAAVPLATVPYPQVAP